MDLSDRSYRRQARALGIFVTIGAIFGLILGVVVLLFNPMDNEALGLVGVVFFGPVIMWGVRGFKRAKARRAYARIDAAQFPELHALVQKFSDRAGLRELPPAYLVSDEAINPCAADMGARPSARIGSDFFAGCRENDAPEALEFMVAHQIAHLKAGHGSHWWSMVVASVRLMPVLNAVVARYMEFHADHLAAQMVPEGAAKAIGLCQVGKDNFPYLNQQVQFSSAGKTRGLWGTLAKWSGLDVSPSERYARLVDANLVPQPEDSTATSFVSPRWNNGE
ncbi:M48 family metalloprotease [Corynebacterium gerontici]|nr:hypothetical protein [Corynebacterium gerontici]